MKSLYCTIQYIGCHISDILVNTIWEINNKCFQLISRYLKFFNEYLPTGWKNQDCFSCDLNLGPAFQTGALPTDRLSLNVLYNKYTAITKLKLTIILDPAHSMLGYCKNCLGADGPEFESQLCLFFFYKVVGEFSCSIWINRKGDPFFTQLLWFQAPSTDLVGNTRLLQSENTMCHSDIAKRKENPIENANPVSLLTFG